MSIEEVKTAKGILEKIILTAVSEFEKKTGTSVARINLAIGDISGVLGVEAQIKL